MARVGRMSINVKILRVSILWIALVASASAQAKFTAAVMAPLKVGGIYHPNDAANNAAWADFDEQLKKMKKAGVQAVSTDIWWGVVAANEGQFNWEYYDKMVKHLKSAGLKWVAILSFHKCGGNAGDKDCYFPVPSWIWTKYIGKHSLVTNSTSLKYKSEQKQFSPEYVSAWGTRLVADDYVRFMTEFQSHFSSERQTLVEINISLGPAGELRYPSYNSHDVGTGYPYRGGIQAYSDLAVDSFRKFVSRRYGNSLAAVNRSWGSQLTQINQIFPPSDPGDAPPDQFFLRGGHRTAYGKDFFEWYHQSLVEHGKFMLKTAVEVFNAPTSPFSGIDIGAKISGVHWRMASDRLAELTAGLIGADEENFRKGPDGKTPVTAGYDSIVSVFAPNWGHQPKVVLHFTCLEKGNFEDQDRSANSLAQTLVFWVASAADRQQVPIKGENALPMDEPGGWQNLKNAIQYASYIGLTILRIGEINDYALDQYKDLINYARNLNTKKKDHKKVTRPS